MPEPDWDTIAEQEAESRLDHLARFDSDPDALAWARAYVQRRIIQFRQFEAKARDRGDEEMASRWRRHANLLQMDFIGGTGCVIAAFDERKPSLPSPGEVAW